MPAKIEPGQEFIGIGIAAPLRQGSTGEFETAAAIELVRSSYRHILGTQRRVKNTKRFIAPGRFFRDEFGTNTRSFKHDPVTPKTLTLLETNYVQSLNRIEKRAVVTSIKSSLDEDNYEIKTLINFKLRKTNQSGNIVVIRDSRGNITFSALESVGA